MYAQKNSVSLFRNTHSYILIDIYFKLFILLFICILIKLNLINSFYKLKLVLRKEIFVKEAYFLSLVTELFLFYASRLQRQLRIVQLKKFFISFVIIRMIIFKT